MRALVVGAGLAGLTGALRLRQAGLEVVLVTFGTGGIQLGQGTVDVLGYAPHRVTRPLEELRGFAEARPAHPYGLIGTQAVAESCAWLRDQMPDLLVGDGTQNTLVPTGLGSWRPTALAQPTMTGEQSSGDASYLVVGLTQLKDFPADLVAGNLARQPAPSGGTASARAVWVDVQPRDEADSFALTYARALERPAFVEELAAAVRAHARPGETVLLPVSSTVHGTAVHAELQRLIGNPVVEVHLPPPSVPGMRINLRLTELVKRSRVRMMVGSRAVGLETSGSRVTGVWVGTAGSPTLVRADAVLHAPGGFESGALEYDSYGHLREHAFNLPVWAPDTDLVTSDGLSAQALFQCGVAVGDDMRPLDTTYDNLHLAGGILRGADRAREKSGDGIALGSMWRATNAILKEAR